MSAVSSPVPVTASTQLLDKYMLPKVALTVITIASLVGAWLTMTTHSAGALGSVAVRWLHLISFAALAGGLMWISLFIRPADKPAQAPFVARFVAASQGRFRRIAQVALPLFLLTALLDLVRFSQCGVGWLAGREAALRGQSPNGGVRGLVVGPGLEDEAGLTGDGPLLIVEAWSWLELVPVTGQFRAAIALGHLRDRDQRHDVTGGVVRGDALTALALSRRSRERVTLPEYQGPALWHLGELAIDGVA